MFPQNVTSSKRWESRVNGRMHCPLATHPFEAREEPTETALP